MNPSGALKDAVLVYLTLKPHVDEGYMTASPKDAYYKYVVAFLGIVGENLERVERTIGSLDQDFPVDDLVRYRAWSEEHRSQFSRANYSTRGLSALAQDKGAAAVAAGIPRSTFTIGFDLESTVESLDGLALSMQAFARPRAFDGKPPSTMNGYWYLWLTQTKVPRRLKAFDEVIHSLIPHLSNLGNAIRSFMAGDRDELARIAGCAEVLAVEFSRTVGLINEWTA